MTGGSQTFGKKEMVWQEDSSISVRAAEVELWK